MKRKLTYAGILSFALSPLIAFATGPSNIDELAGVFIRLLNAGTGMLIAAGILAYFYGIAMSMRKFGEGEATLFKSYFIWGIIAIFVMVSIWGIVNLISGAIFGSQ